MSLDQELLRQLLLRPNHPLVGILDETLRRQVTPSVALLMLKSGTYGWCGSTRRVRKMWQVNKASAWVPCYRTTEAPTLQPSTECLRTRYVARARGAFGFAGAKGTRNGASLGRAVRREANVAQHGLTLPENSTVRVRLQPILRNAKTMQELQA